MSFSFPAEAGLTVGDATQRRVGGRRRDLHPSYRRAPAQVSDLSGGLP
jgi:hypothetical protein